MRKFLMVLVVLFLAAGLAFAGGKTEEAKTLVYGTTEKLTNLDPAEAYDFHTWEIFQNIYRGLLSYTPGTTDLIPGLAESYSANAAGDQYTFKLRKNLNIIGSWDIIDIFFFDIEPIQIRDIRLNIFAKKLIYTIHYISFVIVAMIFLLNTDATLSFTLPSMIDL